MACASDQSHYIDTNGDESSFSKHSKGGLLSIFPTQGVPRDKKWTRAGVRFGLCELDTCECSDTIIPTECHAGLRNPSNKFLVRVKKHSCLV